MVLRPENASRKLDAIGRITIPKSLRDRIGIKENEELDFYTLEADGKLFICLGNPHEVDPKYIMARKVLEELGAEVPEVLLEKFDGIGK